MAARRGRAGGGKIMYGSVLRAWECALPMNAYPINPTPISGVELKSTVHHYCRWSRMSHRTAFWLRHRWAVPSLALCVLLGAIATAPASAEESGPAAAIAAY